MNALTDLQLKVDQYLAERHLLGFELKSMGPALSAFAEYIANSSHEGPLTIQVMAEWAQEGKKSDSKPYRAARRLKKLRPFCRWLQQFEPLTNVPDETVFGPIQERVAPHIYRDTEIVELLAAASKMNPQTGFRPVVYETLFGLIASAGLRVSEALALLENDVDLDAGTLTVRETKFAKTRLLPLHRTTVRVLKRYRDCRRRFFQSSSGTPFFINTRGKLLGTRLSERHTQRVFVQLRNGLKWPDRGAHGGPRIHDLRHSFAVRRVRTWYEEGKDIDAEMLALSTYMGHVKISNTYWYLSSIPELMALAGNRFELFACAPELGDE